MAIWQKDEGQPLLYMCESPNFFSFETFPWDSTWYFITAMATVALAYISYKASRRWKIQLTFNKEDDLLDRYGRAVDAYIRSIRLTQALIEHIEIHEHFDAKPEDFAEVSRARRKEMESIIWDISAAYPRIKAFYGADDFKKNFWPNINELFKAHDKYDQYCKDLERSAEYGIPAEFPKPPYSRGEIESIIKKEHREVVSTIQNKYDQLYALD